MSSLRDAPALAGAPPAPFCGSAGLFGASTTDYDQLVVACPGAGDFIASIDLAVSSAPLLLVISTVVLSDRLS